MFLKFIHTLLFLPRFLFFLYKHKENCDGSFNAQIRYYTNFYIATMDKKSNIL